MADAINRRLTVLEAKQTEGNARVLVFNARKDGDYGEWRAKQAHLLNVKGRQPMVVIIRDVIAEMDAASSTKH